MKRGRRQRISGDGRIEMLLARRSQRRAKLLFWVTVALASFLGWRLYWIQVHDGPALAAKALRQQSAVIRVSAERGAIYTSDGVLLAHSLPSRSVYASPRAVVDIEATAKAIAPILHQTPVAVAARIRAMPTYHVIAWKIPDEESSALLRLDLPGITVDEETSGKRFIPSGRLASTVLGFVGRDDDGLDGVEYEFDHILRGTEGLMTLETDEFARALPFAKPHWITKPKNGDTIVLTLDSYLQYTAQHVLEETVHSFGAMSGSAIVMDPNNGALVAVANVPNYDVNAYDAVAADARRDRAVADAYEPGSTFKLITATAALESGKVTTESRFPARDRLEVGGSVIHNAEDGFMAGTGGSERLEDIIAYSHNVGAAEVGLFIGRTRLYRMMRAFGFGDPTEVDLPGENPGLLPELRDWSATSLPTMSFGHGVAITPLALIRAYCAIANGGLLLRPHIVSAILDPQGHLVYRYGREVERRVMSQRTAAILRGFLRQVVLRGTGHPTAEIPGYTTAGKTGTAQVAEGGGYLPGAYIASFVGLVPAQAPRFVILVKVERPRTAIYGSVVAAPAFAKIARAAMLQAGVMPSPSPSPSALPALENTHRSGHRPTLSKQSA
ncbi:MAG: penicillin-binding protein 2 [Candidatus Eremiobacteraeota bacterium]|nr:penicillin-binding protein 2 [Candidatus Eremiobacteraeota bacterium]MBV9647096.1 penicillin-binding protein 2 [Candidatus Eremiobacteraeota bacterium]